MAQLKSTVVQGSLRVTDTVNTTNLNLSSATASKIVKTDANKNLIAGALIDSEIPVISITSGTTGTLTIARGGTSLTASPSMLTNLSTTAAANVLQASPRPGVTGTLPVSNGGTGASSFTANSIVISGTSTTAALSSISITPGAFFSSDTGTATFDVLPIAQGGTSLTSSPSMLTNLATTVAANILQASPRPGVTGTLPISNGGTGLTTTSPNFVFSGTSTGTTSAAPSWRKLVNADLPIVEVAHGGTGVDSTTSNLVFASPNNINGQLNSGAPSFRKIVSADFGDLPVASTTGYGIIYSNTAPANVSAGSIWMRPTSVTIEELKCYVVPINNFTGTATYNNSNITNDMVVINHEFSDPTVVIGDITWDTTTGSLIVTGDIADQESTNITLYLLKSRGT